MIVELMWVKKDFYHVEFLLIHLYPGLQEILTESINKTNLDLKKQL